MCTVIVGFDPGAETPLVVAALRDEMRDRAWQPPAAHWDAYPDLIGGRDTREGGTWLAARDPGAAADASGAGAGTAAAGGPRVAALLNGLPPATTRPPQSASPGSAPRVPAPASAADLPGTTVPSGTTRYSRGRLPLAAAASGEFTLGTGEALHYDPFHLLIADPDRAVLHSWDGTGLSETRLAAGVTVLVNSGRDTDAPRARRHGPEFARTRPEPGAAEAAGADSVQKIWGEWPALLDEAARGSVRTDGFGPRTDDPSSLIARAEFADGRAWATSSITLVACTRGGLRYAFTAAPGDPAAWSLLR
ncbi:hypothetical protein GCM10027570_51670 [Streptomonospora sediminis]